MIELLVIISYKNNAFWVDFLVLSPIFVQLLQMKNINNC